MASDYDLPKVPYDLKFHLKGGETMTLCGLDKEDAFEAVEHFKEYTRQAAGHCAYHYDDWYVVPFDQVAAVCCCPCNCDQKKKGWLARIFGG